MKTLEAANKFELEYKPAEANGKVYLTQEVWEKKSTEVGVSYFSYSSLSMKVLYNLSSCELKKKERKRERNSYFSEVISFLSHLYVVYWDWLFRKSALLCVYSTQFYLY